MAYPLKQWSCEASVWGCTTVFFPYAAPQEVAPQEVVTWSQYGGGCYCLMGWSGSGSGSLGSQSDSTCSWRRRKILWLGDVWGEGYNMVSSISGLFIQSNDCVWMEHRGYWRVCNAISRLPKISGCHEFSSVQVECIAPSSPSFGCIFSLYLQRHIPRIASSRSLRARLHRRKSLDSEQTEHIQKGTFDGFVCGWVKIVAALYCLNQEYHHERNNYSTKLMWA